MNFYLHRLLFKAGFFKKVNYRLRIRLNGRVFKIPVIHEAGYHNILRTEPWGLELFSGLLSIRKGTFIDVGMNIGQTLLKIASLDPSLPYLGFEPNPLCFYHCSRLIAENELTSFEVYPVGLSDKQDLLTLYLNKNYASGASVLREFRKNMSSFTTRIQVPVWQGDLVPAIQQTADIAILKADVEGSELEVIRGLEKTIARTHPFIVLEILPVYDGLSENGIYRKKREEDLITLLTSLGYRMYRIGEQQKVLYPIQDIPVHGDLSRTNYLFVHHTEVPMLGQMSSFRPET